MADVQARVVKGANGETSLYLFSDEKTVGGASARYVCLSVDEGSLIMLMGTRGNEVAAGEDVAMSGLADALVRAFAHVQPR